MSLAFSAFRPDAEPCRLCQVAEIKIQGFFSVEGRASDKPWAHWRCPRPHHGPRSGHRNEQTVDGPRLLIVAACRMAFRRACGAFLREDVSPPARGLRSRLARPSGAACHTLGPLALRRCGLERLLRGERAAAARAFPAWEWMGDAARGGVKRADPKGGALKTMPGYLENTRGNVSVSV